MLSPKEETRILLNIDSLLVACILGDTMSNGAYLLSEGHADLPLINLRRENSESSTENTFERPVLSPILLSSDLPSSRLDPDNSLGLSEALDEEYQLHTFGIDASNSIVSTFYGSEQQLTPEGELESKLEPAVNNSGVSFSPLRTSMPSSSRWASPVMPKQKYDMDIFAILCTVVTWWSALSPSLGFSRISVRQLKLGFHQAVK